MIREHSYKNPLCYTEKREWVERHLGMEFVKRLIISPNKGLNRGAYLIDDHTSGKGQEGFAGKLIHFGSAAFPDWGAVIKYFESRMMDITLRPLIAADCPAISAAFTAQGWDKPVAQYERYLQEQIKGSRDVIIATIEEAFAGYVTICWKSGYPPFAAAGIPEIVDFNVLKKYQRQGIGTALMEAAEKRIARISQYAGIGVGMYADYGAAQVLYAKRGYIPDGRGLIKQKVALQYGDEVMVDDDLILYFTKRLT